VLLKIIKHTMQLLTSLGALIEAPGQTYFAETDTNGALRSLRAASCTDRIAIGPRTGCMQCSRTDGADYFGLLHDDIWVIGTMRIELHRDSRRIASSAHKQPSRACAGQGSCRPMEKVAA
jgi:hypothetical protein